jgi:hypothetical protein
MTKPAWPRGHTLKVRVTPQERAEIERLAAATRLPVATFLRNLGLGYVPKSTLDAQHVRDLLKLGGDIGRLGGLLKLWLAEARKASAARPLPTWQEWLQTQASQGNALAAEVLRSTSQRQAELGVAVLSAENAEQARHVVYQHLRPSVGRDGAITYRVADGGRVTDQAQHVRVDEVSVAATFLALSLASDRFGDRALVVKGTDDFKRQVAQLAAVEGMSVTFADPDMEAERQRELVAAHARQAQQPARPARSR